MSKRKNDEPKLSLNPCKLKSDGRGGRSSRLGMFLNLFAMVWAPIFALFQFLAILGLVVGAGTVFVGVLGGVGLLVLVGWFVVNLLQDATSWSDKSYRAWRKDGGDPYFDLTWFWPLNSDSDEVRCGKGYIVCPNPECGGTFSARPDQPKPPTSVSRGVEVSDALRKQATDLRMAVLMGKLPEDTGLLIDTKVAAKLNISPRTLYRLQCEKAVPEPIRIAGNMIRWRLAELLAWIDADCPPQREWTYGTATSKNKRNR